MKAIKIITHENTGVKNIGVTEDSQLEVYTGKVSNNYSFKRGHTIAIAKTDRLSAFNHRFPTPIPHKGQVLNAIASHFLQEANKIVPTWFKKNIGGNISVGLKCSVIPLEIIVRGYITGSAWRKYRDGTRIISGITFPDGLKENQKLSTPVITPTEKSGSDPDITRQEIIERGILVEDAYTLIEQYALNLFEQGSQLADERGLILVDTKYEFGITQDGEIVLVDEVHTPDSSRYWKKENYERDFASGQKIEQLSKEFIREWLIEKGFQGKEGDIAPYLTEEIVHELSNKYIAMYETITGKEFVKQDLTEDDVRKALYYTWVA